MPDPRPHTGAFERVDRDRETEQLVRDPLDAPATRGDLIIVVCALVQTLVAAEGRADVIGNAFARELGDSLRKELTPYVREDA